MAAAAAATAAAASTRWGCLRHARTTNVTKQYGNALFGKALQQHGCSAPCKIRRVADTASASDQLSPRRSLAPAHPKEYVMIVSTSSKQLMLTPSPRRAAVQQADHAPHARDAKARSATATSKVCCKCVISALGRPKTSRHAAAGWRVVCEG